MTEVHSHTALTAAAPPPGARPSLLEWAWLALCVATGVACRCIGLSARPLWTDEFTTLITAGRPLGQSLFNFQDPQPPLYPLLLRWLVAAPGQTTVAAAPEGLVRLPALVAGCLVVPAAWWFCRSVMAPRRQTALVAGLVVALAAVNPALIHYAREARPYSFFVLFVLLSLTFLHRLLGNGGWLNVAGYALCTAGMFWSHYYAILYLAGQVLYAASDGFLGGPTRRRLPALALGIALALAASAIPLWMFLVQFRAGFPGAWWISRPHASAVFDVLGELLGVGALGALALVPLLAWAWPTPGRLDTDGNDPEPAPRSARWRELWLGRRGPALCAVAVFSGLLLPFAVSVVGRPGFVDRYALPVLVPLLVLGVGYLAIVNRPALGLVIVLLVAGSMVKLRAEWRGEAGMPQVVAHLAAHTAADQPVYVMDWEAPPAFKADFQHPEVFGLRYYGLQGHPVVLQRQPPTWDAARLRDYVLPPVPMLVVAYGTTHRSLVAHLSSTGRSVRVTSFGNAPRWVHVVAVGGR